MFNNHMARQKNRHRIVKITAYIDPTKCTDLMEMSSNVKVCEAYPALGTFWKNLCAVN